MGLQATRLCLQLLFSSALINMRGHYFRSFYLLRIMAKNKMAIFIDPYGSTSKEIGLYISLYE